MMHPSVGDLDLAIDLIPKEPDGEKHSAMIRATPQAT
jgi:hypothetical protein